MNRVRGTSQGIRSCIRQSRYCLLQRLRLLQGIFQSNCYFLSGALAFFRELERFKVARPFSLPRSTICFTVRSVSFHDQIPRTVQKKTPRIPPIDLLPAAISMHCGYSSACFVLHVTSSVVFSGVSMKDHKRTALQLPHFSLALVVLHPT